MSMALTLVISIVVLIVVSLAVISITTGNVAQTGQNTQNTQRETFCDIAIRTECGTLSPGASYSVTCDGETVTGTCPGTTASGPACDPSIDPTCT